MNTTTQNFTPRVGKQTVINYNGELCLIEITFIYGCWIESRKVINGIVSPQPLDIVLMRTGAFYEASKRLKTYRFLSIQNFQNTTNHALELGRGSNPLRGSLINQN